MYILPVIGGIIMLLFIIFLIVLIIWRIFIKRGQKNFDAKTLTDEGGKYVVNDDGRRIEYFVYGSMYENAPVVVNIHGSWLEATFEVSMHNTICESLGVKGIAISLPGTGYTDMKVWRTISDRPAHDLRPVLDQEKVKDFFVTGHSQGTAHAMAVAKYFPERCKGMGLNAPLLPIDISNVIGIRAAIWSDSLLSTQQLKKPWMSWYFFLFYLWVDLFSPGFPFSYITKTTPKLLEDDVLIDRLKTSLRRSVMRWSIGNAWESTMDVCYEWGFDPREIRTNNICIWHAKDDVQCPPEIGARLANYFTDQWSQVSFKDEDEWYGHFTYCRGEYLEARKSMIWVLVNSTV